MRTASFILIAAALPALPSDAWGAATSQPAGKPAAAPTTAPSDGPVAVYVNGAAVPMATLNDLLLQAGGLEMARHLVAGELVRQEAARHKIEITDADVQAEHDRTLRRMFGESTGDAKGGAGEAAARQREQLLDQLLVQRKVSRVQWRLTMRRSAALRKLAGRDLTVTDQEIRDEFNDRFGRKVVVRHIQTASLADVEKILKRLAEKADFAELARKYSTNAATRNAPLPPIGKNPDNPALPPAMRQTALAMKKVGEVSEPIQTGTAFHLLKLEAILKPDKAKFEDVEDDLRDAVRSRKLLLGQQQILQRLIREANIEYVNPILKQQSARRRQP